MGGAKTMLCDAERHGTAVPSSVDDDHGSLRGTMDRLDRETHNAGREHGDTGAQEHRWESGMKCKRQTTARLGDWTGERANPMQKAADSVSSGASPEVELEVVVGL
jgi:hypothetical protein